MRDHLSGSIYVEWEDDGLLLTDDAAAEDDRSTTIYLSPEALGLLLAFLRDNGVK